MDDPELLVVTALVAQPGGGMSHGLERYRSSLERLVATGLPTLLYLDPGLPLALEAPNLRIEPLRYGDLATVRAAAGRELVLPAHRDARKDTAAYLLLMNAKPELLVRAIRDGHRARRYAWVDAGVFGIVADVPLAQARLRGFAGLDPSRLWMPGCRPEPRAVLEHVDWRYAGPLIVGGPGPLLELGERHAELFRALLPRLAWEINLWSMLELRGAIRPRWYLADHDDSLFAAPGIRPA